MSKIVYILTNPSMPGLIKIGATSHLQKTMRDLYQANVPQPFQCFYAGKVDNAESVAQGLHQLFADHRVSPARDFLRMDAQKVLYGLQLANPKDVTPTKEHQPTLKDKPSKDKPLKEQQYKLSKFVFSKVGIPIGARLTFYRDKAITCKVVGDREIEFEGELYSLTAAARKVLLKKDGPNRPFATGFTGTNYWCYQDERLSSLRTRMEKKDAKDVKDIKYRGKVFAFSKVKIPIGARLTFYQDKAITCKVVDDRRIEFEGEICSVTAAARKVLRKKEGADKSFTTGFTGTKHWCYKNETLKSRRTRMENKGTKNIKHGVRKLQVFAFSKLNIPVGAILTFCKDKTITCKVVDDRKIEFEGELCSLTAAARKVLQRKEGTGKPYTKGFAGTYHWCYEDERIWSRSKRIKKQKAPAAK